MRFAVIAACAAGSAVAGPLHGHFHFHKRQTIVHTDTAVVTAVTTVVVGPSQPSVQTPAATSTAPPQTMPTITWSGQHSRPNHGVVVSSAVQLAAPSTLVESSAPATSATAGGSALPAHPTGTAENTCTSGDDYNNLMLWHHNIHRSNHSLSMLATNTTLITSAHSWATQCNFSHETSGENLYAVSDGPKGNYAVTEAWYYGELDAFGNQWDQSGIAFGEDYGHLTQVLASNTQSLGCSTVDCGSTMHDSKGNSMSERYITVCHYYPAGNVMNSSGMTEVIPKPCGNAAITAED